MKAKLIKIPERTIDDYGDLVKLREAFAPTERQYQRMKKELVDKCDSADPSAEFVVRGERYTLRISACGMERQFDKAMAKRRLGAAKFLECCSISLKALSVFLSGPEIEAFTTTTQSGSRTYTAEETK